MEKGRLTEETARGGRTEGFEPISKQTIRFECAAPEAESVAIAGSFNNWSPEEGLMERNEDGHWLKELTLEPGSYEYCIVVDGVYHADPRSSDTTPNPFGGENSILEVSK